MVPMLNSKQLSLIAATFLGLNVTASTHPFIVTDHAMIQEGQKSLSSLEIIKQEQGIIIAKVAEDEKSNLSHIAHEDHHRCGGYFAFETLAQAESFVIDSKNNDTTKAVLADYTINQEDTVTEYIAKAQELNIRSTMLKLSSFNNRYYKSETGTESQEWLKAYWTDLTKHRSDITVEFFNHSGWSQPSVIATIKGESSDVIVVGGHADSIAGWWSREKARAPGADDNASGIATITETLKVLAESGYTPKKTIKFMAYAAEEVGLLGSKDIARTFKQDGVNVVGVLQSDMTNHNGSNTDITLITDFTNEAQNNFLGNLIDKYLPELTWGRDTCGYACSDHASWTSQGFPASIPFEAKKNDMNHNIHTANDTLERMGGEANHALKFAKLALSFVIELDR